MGDTPGRKGTIGLNESSVLAIGACSVCLCSRYQFGTCPLHPEQRVYRSSGHRNAIHSANNGQTGLPTTREARRMYPQLGVSFNSVVTTFPGTLYVLDLAN